MEYKLPLTLAGLIIIPIIIFFLFRQLYKESFTSGKPYRELLFFTLKGCGHCEKMKPTWDLLKNNYGNNGQIKLINIKARENQDLVQKYKVEGFPTLLYVKDEKIQAEYNGNREYDDLVKFLKHSIAN